MPQRIGVMGGTFDPVHLGHLRTAEEAVEFLDLEALYFIPSASPPHKPGRKILPFEHRWRMLELAVKDHPKFRYSDIEHDLPGKSYTVVTLQKLHEMWRHSAELYFLVGLDAFLELDSWWHYRELFELAHICVLRRPEYREEDVAGFLRTKVSSTYYWDDNERLYRHSSYLPVHPLRNSHLGISSTRIRRLVSEGRSIRYLVLPEVMRYIATKQLYSVEELEPEIRKGNCLL